MANRAGANNRTNKKAHLIWMRERAKNPTPWKIPLSLPKDWKKIVAAAKHKNGVDISKLKGVQA